MAPQVGCEPQDTSQPLAQPPVLVKDHAEPFMIRSRRKLKCFLSYRRNDLIVAGSIHRIYEFLSRSLGEGNVFMDVDRIPPGADFRTVLSDEVSRADVVLVVMGQQWTQLLEERGEDLRDFVRIEIESALERGIPVIPLLVGGASLPSPESLPDSIRELSYRNAFRVDPGRDFERDLSRLVQQIESNYGERRTESVETREVSGEPPLQSQEQSEGIVIEKRIEVPRKSKNEKSGTGSRRKAILTGLGIAALAIVGILALPDFNRGPGRDWKHETSNRAKNLVLNCLAFAGDHQGMFPESLKELHPDYIEELSSLGYEDESGKSAPFEHLTGKNERFPPASILLFSGPDGDGKRIVGFVDGRVESHGSESFEGLIEKEKRLLEKAPVSE